MVVIRNCIIFCLISFLVGFGQNQNPDTNAISRTSQLIIEKKIDFVWKGGTLAQALEQLHQQHGFKFSHAGQQIGFTQLKASTFKDQTLGYILGELLESTHFDYLLVGRMVVIVKRKNQSNKISVTDTSKNKNYTNVSLGATSKNHIYSSNRDLEGLSWYEKRIIYKTFQRELKWQQRRQAAMAGKDSSDTQKAPSSVKKNTRNQFIEVSVGVLKPLLSHKDNTVLAWESELDFKQSSKTTLNAELGLGWVTGHFLLGTGLGYRSISTQTTWMELRRRPLENVKRSASEKYDIVTIPLKAMVYKQWNNIFGAAGIALKFNFIQLDLPYGNKFKRYYDDNTVGSTYFQKTNKVCLSSAFLFTGGMVWKERYIFTATGAYEPYWRALESNSVYKLFPHQLSLNVGLIYLFDLKGK